MSDIENTKRAMAALDTMAMIWASEVKLREMIQAILKSDDLSEKIYSLAHQSFIEGAYRHFCDVKDGKVPNMTYTASPPSASAQGWVSVSDRFPEPGVCVLTWDGKNKCIEDWTHDGWGMRTVVSRMGDADDEYRKVTHWLPLPAPPTTQEKAP